MRANVLFPYCELWCRWESKAILRYIANKHNLEAWYSTDAKQRAICDLALDLHANNFAPIVGPKLVFPAIGFGSPTPEELTEAEAKWTNDVWPAIEHILKRSGGPFIGGAKPCIADLAFMGYLVMLFGKCPSSFVAKTAGLKSYFDALKAALPKYSEYTAAAQSLWKPE